MRFGDWLRIVRTRKWIIIQAVAVVMIVAVGSALVERPSYEGVTQILITDKDVGAAIFGSAFSELTGNTERVSQTQAQVVKSQPVLERAIAALKLKTTPDLLLEQIDVSAVGQTDVIEIVAIDGDSKRAAAIANAVDNANVDWSRESKRESITSASEEVQRRMDEVKTEIIDLGSQPPSQQLETELSIANTKYATLAQKLEELRVNEQLQVGSGRVMRVAAPDTSPVSPKPVRNAALGLIAGLVAGMVIAVGTEYLDNTVKSTEEAEEILGAPVLGNIPGEKLEKGESRRLSIVQDPGGAAAEAYRVLRSNLSFVNFQRDIKTLLITSSLPAEGKSTVSANLATALALTGSSVVLINADFHRPVTEELLPVTNQIGLSDVLMGVVSLEDAMQQSAEGAFVVVNSGKAPPNPSELLNSDRMGEIIRGLREAADWVVFDGPPLLAASDALALARWADGVLMCVHGGVSTRQSLAAGREMLDKVGARIVGLVVWGITQDQGISSYGAYGSLGSYSRDDRADREEKSLLRGLRVPRADQ